MWMCDVVVHNNDVADDGYTCPDQTKGRFYRGLTFLSVVDERNRVINTISIHFAQTNEGTFDLPYRIAPYFYHVEGKLDRHGEGKARVLW